MDPQFLILLAFFGVMYLLLIRPQQKKQKQHAEMVRSVAAGTDVVTIGGLHGRVVAVDDETIDLAVDADGTLLRFQRSAIARIVTDEPTEVPDEDAGSEA